MKALLVVLTLLVVTLVPWWWRRREPSTTIQGTDVLGGVAPTRVTLPDQDAESDERPARRRTGETQQRRRRIVHGSARPIDDRGAPTGVQPPRPA